MNKASGIFNPYNILMLGVFIRYSPAFYNSAPPSISIGPVSLYTTDFGFILLCFYAFFIHLGGQSRLVSRGRYEGKSVLIILGLFFVFGCIKWILQSNHDISSIRTLLAFAGAYPFLFLFPMLVTGKEGLKKLHYFLIIFLVYIFLLHIYAYSTRGFHQHILGGNFLSMLSLLYFLAIVRGHVLDLPAKAGFLVKALVITTFFMSGHRSGFVGLLLGLATLLFFNKRLAVKEAGILLVIITMGAGAAFILSPDILSKISERASTTFDASQETYEHRYENIFLVTRISLKEYPIIGKPFAKDEALTRKSLTEKKGSISIAKVESVIAPHNLFLEWLHYYGSIGLLLGLMMVILSIRFIKRFLTKYKNDRKNYQLGVAILCCMAHNLFFALSNVTTTALLSTFFLYLPLIILVGISRNNMIFYK